MSHQMPPWQRLARKLNVLAIATGLAGAVASVLLHSPAGIIAGVAAVALGAIGIYTTRRQT